MSPGHVYRADIVALTDAADDLQYLTHGCLQWHKNTMTASFCHNIHNIFMWAASKRGCAQIFVSHMLVVKQMLMLLQCLYRDSLQSLNTLPWRLPALNVTFSQKRRCSYWPPPPTHSNTHICTHTGCLNSMFNKVFYPKALKYLHNAHNSNNDYYWDDS